MVLKMKVLFATSNHNKVAQAKIALPDFEVEQLDADVFEIKSLNLQETIERKAIDTFNLVKKPVVVEDTCLFFEAYENFPGTYSKFCYQTLGLNGLLKLLEGKDRKAKFVSSVAFIEAGMEKPIVFSGEMNGRISEKIVGKIVYKMPYATIFIPSGSDKTFNELTSEEKNAVSHRASAFRKLGEWLKERKRKKD
ncbi:non-canonical purine NTP pyrophosphatase [Candidatus Micrarchaeota archaeon]|nr:non-canonical purine NTP pyrophosphatase [Candidatus Micrarchaeota archaeon]